MKKLNILIISIFICIMSSITVFAANVSTVQRDPDGVWRIYNDGIMLRNSWVGDIATQSIWYVVDNNGCIIAGTLLRDRNGNHYTTSLNANNYGQLITYDTVIDGTYLKINTQHNGVYGAIINDKDICGLIKNYGVKDISYITNTIYTNFSNCPGYVPVTPQPIGPGTPGAVIPSMQTTNIGDIIYNNDGFIIQYLGSSRINNQIQCIFNISNSNISSMTIDACDHTINGMYTNTYISTDLVEFTASNRTSATIAVTIPYFSYNTCTVRYRFKIFNHNTGYTYYTKYISLNV